METQVQTISDEALAAAAEWWAKAIDRPKFDNGGTDEANMLSRMLMTIQAQPVTEAQLDTFKTRLIELLREKSPVESLRPDLCLHVDYHADQVLCDAADAAGIQHENFPWKTVMWIDADGGGKVTVRHGYGAETQLVYGDPIFTVYGVSKYLIEWAAGRKSADRPGLREFYQQGKDCEQAIGRLAAALKFRNWPAPELTDSERVASVDGTREYAYLEILGGIVNDQVELARTEPSPETYLAAILAYTRLSNQMAGWCAVLTTSE